MAFMLVNVLPLPIAFIPRFALLPDAVRVWIFEIVPVRVQMLMEMGIDVTRDPMVVLMIMVMAMGVLVLILVVMLLFHGHYRSFLTCTSSDRYSALSASVV